MTMPNPSPSGSPAVILLPADRFFVQRVPIEPAAEAAPQVALALEGLAPFPPSQLYSGHLRAAAGDQALVFAAYRRRFAPEEAAAWDGAGAVLPGFMALLGPGGGAPWLKIHAGAAAVTGVAWDGTGPLPAAVIARAVPEGVDDGDVDRLAAELCAAAGLPDPPLEVFHGEATATRAPGGALVFAIGGTETGRLEPGDAAEADIRDRVRLGQERRRRRRERMWWRAGLAATAVVALAAAVEIGAAVLAGVATRRRDLAERQAPRVERLEKAEALSARVGELAHRRLQPFHMLAYVNAPRPATVRFTRASTVGSGVLEVEAETPRAADVSAYEAALRALPGIAAVEVRDLRAEGGVTTFALRITLAEDPAVAGGESS